MYLRLVRRQRESEPDRGEGGGEWRAYLGGTELSVGVVEGWGAQAAGRICGVGRGCCWTFLFCSKPLGSWSCSNLSYECAITDCAWCLQRKLFLCSMNFDRTEEKKSTHVRGKEMWLFGRDQPCRRLLEGTKNIPHLLPLCNGQCVASGSGVLYSCGVE